jgi:hypothetical protein
MIAHDATPVELIRLVHPSGTGGTSVCAWAHELEARSEETGSGTGTGTGVRTVSPTCNTACTQPPWNSIIAGTRLHGTCHSGHSCAEFKQSVGNATWVHTENGLRLREWPCRGVIDAMLIRDPWERVVHALFLSSKSTAERADVCRSVLTRPDRVDNLYTRSLLGLPTTAERGGDKYGLGAINATHLQRARTMLSAFVIIPTHDMEAGFARLIEAVERRNRATGVAHLRLAGQRMAIHTHRSKNGTQPSSWLGVLECEALHSRFSQLNWVDNALYQYALAKVWE